MITLILNKANESHIDYAKSVHNLTERDYAAMFTDKGRKTEIGKISRRIVSLCAQLVDRDLKRKLTNAEMVEAIVQFRVFYFDVAADKIAGMTDEDRKKIKADVAKKTVMDINHAVAAELNRQAYHTPPTQEQQNNDVVFKIEEINEDNQEATGVIEDKLRHAIEKGNIKIKEPKQKPMPIVLYAEEKPTINVPQEDEVLIEEMNEEDFGSKKEETLPPKEKEEMYPDEEPVSAISIMAVPKSANENKPKKSILDFINENSEKLVGALSDHGINGYEKTDNTCVLKRDNENTITISEDGTMQGALTDLSGDFDADAVAQQQAKNFAAIIKMQAEMMKLNGGNAFLSSNLDLEIAFTNEHKINPDKRAELESLTKNYLVLELKELYKKDKSLELAKVFLGLTYKGVPYNFNDEREKLIEHLAKKQEALEKEERRKDKVYERLTNGKTLNSDDFRRMLDNGVIELKKHGDENKLKNYIMNGLAINLGWFDPTEEEKLEPELAKVLSDSVDCVVRSVKSVVELDSLKEELDRIFERAKWYGNDYKTQQDLRDVDKRMNNLR